MTQFATLAGMNAAVDLRTPRSSYDAFCRSILQGKTEQLWSIVHPELRFLLQRQYYQMGEFRFLSSLRDLVAGGGLRLALGNPEPVTSGTVRCPRLRSGHQVGQARFSFSENSWLLYSLN